MTVANTLRRAGPYQGNGTATAFPFGFKVYTKNDIAVVLTDAAGVATILAVDADYSVVVNSNQNASPGGTVTYPITGLPLPIGSTLTILGNLAYSQVTQLPAGGAYNATNVEDALDRSVILSQQLLEAIARATQLPISAVNVSPFLPQPEGGSVIGWNASGTALQNYDVDVFASTAQFANWQYQTFVADGITANFALAGNPVTEGNTDVSIAGVTQVPGTDYNIIGTALAFASPPPAGTTILIRYGQAAAQAGALLTCEQYVLVATAGQTVFVVPSGLPFAGNTIAVYLNGLRLVFGDDYTQTASSAITLASPAANGDELVVVVGREAGDSIPAGQVSVVPAGGLSATTVQAALEELQTEIAAGGGGAVDSVFGRTGVVAAQAGDYAADQIDVDATGLTHSTATDVQAVLEDFDAAITAAAGTGGGGAVDSVFGRTGVVTAQTGDYQASQVSVSPSGNLTSMTVQAALEELQTEIDAIDATVVQTFSQTVGDGATTAFTLSHQFGSYDVTVLVRTATGSPRTQLETSAYDVSMADEDNLTVTFATAPTAGQYEIFLATFTAGGEVGGVPLPGTQIYDTAGTYSFVVPGGVTELDAKVWGAGGGGATYAGASRVGGGGGFAWAKLAVTPGETLTIRVGGGGAAANFAGWTGTGNYATNALPSFGGNLCGVFRGATLLSSTPLVIGGSGAGAGVAQTTTTTNFTAGGSGGGSSGTANSVVTAGYSASGGTQVSAGTAGAVASSNYTPIVPVAGSYLGNGTQGGRHGNYPVYFGFGGGGGGGYYSGGGGGALGTTAASTAVGAGGGGGSGYVPSVGSPLLASGAPAPTLTAGSGQTPAGTADPDYGLTSAGLGGGGGANGNPGRVVLIW